MRRLSRDRLWRVLTSSWGALQISQLAKTPAGLDGYQWHANLSSFGHSAANDTDGNPETEDESEAVVNLLVTSTVIPRLEKLAATYDPLSARQTQRAVGVVDEVSYCVDKSSHRFEVSNTRLRPASPLIVLTRALPFPADTRPNLHAPAPARHHALPDAPRPAPRRPRPPPAPV